MDIITPNVTLYPARFPMPSKVSYSGQIDYGLTVTDINGETSQQRYYGGNPTIVQMQFRMDIEMYKDWSAFVNTYGATDWILMYNVNQYFGFVGTDPLHSDIVRMGDHTMTPLGDRYVSVGISVELLPRDIGDGIPGMGRPVSPPLDISDWIVAGDPANPSSPDWIVAGDPTAPSVDTITSGTPQDHGS